jgi:hypothetical protein
MLEQAIQYRYFLGAQLHFSVKIGQKLRQDTPLAGWGDFAT